MNTSTTTTFTLRCNPDERDRWAAIASSHGLTISGLLRVTAAEFERAHGTGPLDPSRESR